MIRSFVIVTISNSNCTEWSTIQGVIVLARVLVKETTKAHVA